MSTEWEDLFPLTTVHKLSREISDHNPLILDTLEARIKKNKEFRFEKGWIREDDFLARVDRAWQQGVKANNSLDRMQKKLKNDKNSLKDWGCNLRGRDKKRKNEISQELADLEMREEFSPLSATGIQKRVKIQQELLDILDNEESFWRQRARDDWLLQGGIILPIFIGLQMGARERALFFP
jgi:hypothetical protein